VFQKLEIAIAILLLVDTNETERELAPEHRQIHIDGGTV
jgi:hypothetical protein